MPSIARSVSKRFTADPHFRHIIGQASSTFSVREALDSDRSIILDLHRGLLGEQAITLGSLFFTTIKNAVFSRKTQTLYTLYCDEVQNLIAFGGGLETVLSESRKFGVSIVSANQFLEQLPGEVRGALLAIGSHIYFQLSSEDASRGQRARWRETACGITEEPAATIQNSTTGTDDLLRHVDAANRQTAESSAKIRRAEDQIDRTIPTLDRNYLPVESQRLKNAAAVADQGRRDLEDGREELQIVLNALRPEIRRPVRSDAFHPSDFTD